jgi:hypothetical protein
MLTNYICLALVHFCQIQFLDCDSLIVSQQRENEKRTDILVSAVQCTPFYTIINCESECFVDSYHG